MTLKKKALDVVEPVEPVTSFRLFHWGTNDTEHGPFEITPADGKAIVAAFQKRGTDLSFDYSHDESKSDALGPKIAAGWGALECRKDGVWCTSIRYTKRAAAHIEESELRYFSPWFDYEVDDQGKAHVTNVINVALTNIPATHNIAPIAADVNGKRRGKAGALLDIRHLAPPGARPTTTQGPTKGRETTAMKMSKAELSEMMSEHLSKMCEAICDAVGDDEQEGEGSEKEKPVKAAADAPPVPPKKPEEDEEEKAAKAAKAAASAARAGRRPGISARLSRVAGTEDEDEIAAQLAAGKIALSRLESIEGEMGEIRKQAKASAWDAAISEGKRARKIAPGQVEALAAALDKDPARLRKLLSTMPEIVPEKNHRPASLGGSGLPPEAEQAVALSAGERRMAASFGTDAALVEKYLPRARAALAARKRIDNDEDEG